MFVGLKLNIYYFLARTKMFNRLITNMKNIFGDHLVNRLKTLTNQIKYEWLNESYESFKVKCKNLLL